MVAQDAAHVVIKRHKVGVFSETSDIEGYVGTTCHFFPNCVPVFGMNMTEVPLRVVELRVPEMVTFAARNARFTLPSSVFVRVTNPLRATQRLPGRTMESYIDGVKDLMENAIRNTTTAFAAEDIIEKKDEIASTVQQASLELVSTGEMSSSLDLFSATGGVRL